VLGTYYDIMYNPAKFDDENTLNPFADRKIREATNWLYDRDYINQEIYSGGSLPKYFAIQTNGPDYADLADIARGLEAKYAYNLDQAQKVISEEMTALGATLGADGKWQYKGKPVTLIFLIRPDGDGTRKPMGDYVANQLEKVGFTVDRQYKKSSEAGPIWQKTSHEGQWSMYTAGWINSGIELDAKGDFQQMYLNSSVQGIQPFLSNVADPAFQQLGDDLQNAKFTTVDQRRAMMAQALELSLQDSLQVMIIDTRSYAPYSTDLQISANLAGGIETAPIAFYTLRYKGQVGGTVKWGENDLFTEPLNQVYGSNWAWDQGAIAAVSGSAFMSDPFTGLQWPLRAEKADLIAQTGLPIFKTLDWLNLTTADTIPVPDDAWVRWDAASGKFLTAKEYYTQTMTAKIKSVVYYPADLYTTVKWHDGSPISVGDFVMSMIEFFDRADPNSPIYDEQAVPNVESFLSSFKGVKIVSTDPLVIETYSDNYQSNAELDISSWWPNPGFGEASWDVLSIGNLAEAAGGCAYSPDKAQQKNIEQTSFVGGPTLDILAKQLDEAIANKTIPYAPTMGTYVTADDAVARYTALKAWYGAHGHFWVATGPYYMDKVYLTEKSLVLKSFPDYPDQADRWSSFAQAKIAVVGIIPPADQVMIGSPATFDISVTFNRQPYPASEIKMVKYLLYDATNTVVATGLATAVEDGKYQVVLSGDDTAKLTAGSCKLEVAVVSTVVAVPTFNSVQFITGQ
jgi:peptide/nickel transport system substrate-binding protein